MRQSRYILTALLLILAGAGAHAADEAVDAAERARAGVAEVFARPEFAPLAEAERIPRPDFDLDLDLTGLKPLAETLWEALKKVLSVVGDALSWLIKGIASLFSGVGGLPTNLSLGWVKWVAIALGVLAIAVLVWFLVSNWAGARRAAAARALAAGLDDMELADDALAHTAAGWVAQAQELEGGGRYRESLRALYLGLLRELHGLGVIDYDRTRTNTAYVTDVSPVHPARRGFESLTLRFDRAWYGHEELTKEELSLSHHESRSIQAAFLEDVRRA